MPARIFFKPKSTMQSGTRGLVEWVLEFEKAEARVADPLMGWSGSGDTQSQVRLTFGTSAAAVEYAERHGIPFHLIPTPSKTLKIQSYSDNFK